MVFYLLAKLNCMIIMETISYCWNNAGIVMGGTNFCIGLALPQSGDLASVSYFSGSRM